MSQPRIGHTSFLQGFLLLVTACAPAVNAPAGPAPLSESRVFHSPSRRYVSFGSLADAAAGADVVFFGEHHGDPATHRTELALLAAIGARRGNVVVSLEFLERDVQPTLDAYLAGQIPESLFLAKSRPSKRWATDYRALVELSRAHRWPVVAANVPRSIAASVSRAGLVALDTLSNRSLVARDLSCPHDRYYERFAETMKTHNDSSRTAPAPAPTPAPPPPPMPPAINIDRYYESQCVKDETMAESIVNAWRRAGAGALVVHYNGTFHSDMGQGTAERVRRRAPAAKVLILTALPVDDVARADAAAFADRADYVILVPKPPAPARPAASPSGTAGPPR